MMLIGNSGVGKSTLGTHLIAQSEVFAASAGTLAQSTDVKESPPFDFNGRSFVVIDTPGFPDTDNDKVPLPLDHNILARYL
jgi:putative ribosome biogenesis GTPase RsgA